MDYDQTRAVLAAFEREGVEYVIFGGVALNLAVSYEDLESERVDFDGIEVSVVTARTLYLMKKGIVRPRDRADADRLREHFGFEGE